MKLLKCYYCGDYFPEDECNGWPLCDTCEIRENDEHRYWEEESEEYVLGDLHHYDLPEISVKLAQYEEEDE